MMPSAATIGSFQPIEIPSRSRSAHGKRLLLQGNLILEMAVI